MEKKTYSFQKKDKERNKLHEVIPLNFPYAIDFFVSNACNFKCFYCLQSDDKNGHEYFEKGTMMSLETFCACVDQIKKRGKLKVLTMSGTGEPLINPHIVEMVEYAVKNEVADSVEIVTNGALLNHKLSEGLANAGLSRLRISLQGLDSQAYQEVSKVNLDWNRMCDKIKYFYSVRKNTILYIKVMDFMIKDEKMRKKFYNEFEPYCDQINVENLVPLYNDIDYSYSNSDFGYTLYNTKAVNCQICTRPFFHCAIEYDGSMIPCCILPAPVIYGNAAVDFDEGWNGSTRTDFLIDMLKKNKGSYRACRECKDSIYRTRQTDILDGYEDELIKRLERNRNEHRDI